MSKEQVTDWWQWLAKQGVFAFLLAVGAWWFAQQIVVPMRDDQREFMRSVISNNAALTEVQKTQSEQLAANTELQKNQSTQLAALAEVLRQIRDDQRRGAWNDRGGHASQ